MTKSGITSCKEGRGTSTFGISTRKKEKENKGSWPKKTMLTSDGSSEAVQVTQPHDAGSGVSVLSSPGLPARPRGSIADRWKNATGASLVQDKGKSYQVDYDWDDETTAASVNTRGSVADRWNQKMKELSNASYAQPEVSKETSIAPTSAGYFNGIASEGNISVSVGPTSRWNQVGKTVPGQTCANPQAETLAVTDRIKALQQSVSCETSLKDGSSYPRQRFYTRVAGAGSTDFHAVSRKFENTRPSNSVPEDPIQGPKSDIEVREDDQSSPYNRIGNRKISDHSRKISAEETKSIADNPESQQQARVISKHVPSTATWKYMLIQDTEGPNTRISSQSRVDSQRSSFASKFYSRNTTLGENTTKDTQGAPEVIASVTAKPQPTPQTNGFRYGERNQSAPSWVKTVTVSSPDSVEVIQRGCVGGELSQHVLADALSSDSIVPTTVTAGADSEEADEYSDESKSRPSKIIKSWSVKVYQTEQLPSSPRFSRQQRKFDLAGSKQGPVILDSPKASPGAVCSSKSSAFNAWSGPSLMEQERDISCPSTKDMRGASKLNRDFVSLGRRHIVHGLGSKVGTNKMSQQSGTEDHSLRNQNTSGPPFVQVAQSTSNEDTAPIMRKFSQSTPIMTSSRSADLNPGKQLVKSQSVDREPGLTPDVVLSAESHKPSATSISRSSDAARAKTNHVRKHLPSPRRRRKKNVSVNHKAPVVSKNLSDIVEAYSEDSNGTRPASPPFSDVKSKRKGLQAHRRNLKQGTKAGSLSDVIHAAGIERDPNSTNGAHVNPLEADYSNERAKGKAEITSHRTPTATYQYPTPSLKRKDNNPSNIIRSPVSEVDFSFLTDVNSVHSGITSILSGGSLSNRAEKVLTERKREQRKSVGATSSGKHPNGHFIPVSGQMSEKKTQEANLQRSSERDGCKSERPRLETRYNKSSRFLEPSQVTINAETENLEALQPRKVPAEQNYTHNSTGSSVQSVDSGSDESDTRGTAQSRRKATRKRKMPRRSLLQASSVASEQFLAENAANFDAFSTAYRRFSLRDIANDLAGEIKMLSFNTSSFASSVNSKIALCVNETKKAKNCQGFMGFDEEDVAIEVEFMEDELDDDPTNSIEDEEDDESTLEDQPIAQPGNRLCAPLGYQEARDS